MAVKKTVAEAVDQLIAEAAGVAVKPKRAPRAKKESTQVENENQVEAAAAVDTSEEDAALFSDEVAEPEPAKKTKQPKAPKEPKPAKEPKPVSPYAGLSPHQRNRRIALEKYGTRPDYTGNDFRVKIRADVREDILKALNVGTIRPSAKGKSHGGDRMLIQLAKMGWPEGAATIQYPDELAAEREAREAAKAEAAQQTEAQRAEKQAAKDAAAAAKKAEREAKTIEREAVKAQKIADRAAAKQAKQEAKEAAAAAKAAELSEADVESTEFVEL